MKIIITSDTHNQHDKLEIPKCDIFIHCGDSTSKGTKKEVTDFLKWVSTVDAEHRIVISGNHDSYFFSDPEELCKIIPENVIYLEHDSVTINGLNIFGSPIIPKRKVRSSSVFVCEKEDMEELWSEIPDDTHILITHTPPKEVLDLSKRGDLCGCPDLINRINELKELKLHCFGHIHESFGQKEINGVTFINAAFLNGRYEDSDGFMEFTP